MERDRSSSGRQRFTKTCFRPYVRRYKIMLFTAIAVLTAVGTVAVTGQASSAADTPARFTGTPMHVSGQLAEVATNSSATARSLSRSTYAGVSMNVPGQMVTIYLTSAPSARMVAAVNAGRNASGHVRFKVVKYTLAQLTAGQAALTSAVSSLRHEGIKITDWGPDPITNTLHVGLIGPTKATESVIASAVRVPLTFTSEKSYPAMAATRLADVEPWNGGDFMADMKLGCTTGPPVIQTSTGNQYILSVAHCFGNVTGDFMYNDDSIDSRDCAILTCPYLGMSSHVDTATGYDAALMSGSSYSDLDWENSTPYDPPGTLNGYTNPQETYTRSVVGELVCPSGAYEGMVCGTKVLYVNETVVIGRTLYHIDRAQNTSAIPVGGGDSGGPVFTTPPDHLNIEGIIEARGDAIPCQTYPSRGSECSYTIYYFDFESEAAIWGLALKKS